MNTDRERMETIIIDIETPNETSIENLDTPLRGILKNTDTDSEHNEIYEIRVLNTCISLVILVISIPIIVCDLYFGFNKNNCSTKPHNSIVLKNYLILSGFIGIVSLPCILTNIWLFKTKLDRCSNIYLYSCTIITLRIMSLLSIVINIIAAITFWGLIFNNKTCDQTFIDYMSFTLIIKLLFLSLLFCNGYLIYTSTNNDD